MIKRVTKMTGLLAIATSIMTMVPAMAEDIKSFQDKDGTIYNAVSKGGGIFIIDGYFNDEERAIYSYKDGKFTKLDEAESGDTIKDVCLGKYLELEGNHGLYYVDIETGKESIEYIREIDDRETATKLKNKIKKDNEGGSHLDSNYTNKTIKADSVIGGATTLWSQYSYKLEETNLIGEEYSKIYADKDGNYVDADYNLGNVIIQTTTGSSVAIKNTEDTYKIKEKDGYTYEIKAQIKGDFPYCENPDDFYRKGELSIWAKNVDLKGDYVNITATVEFGPSGNSHEIPAERNDGYGEYVTVMQVISKAQAEDVIDGVKYAKSTKTYFVTDKDGETQSVLGLGTSDKTGIPMIIGNAEGLESYIVNVSEKKVYAETINFKTKGGYNYVDIGNSYSSDFDTFAIGSGQFYCLDGGYVKRWNNKDAFEKMYKVDRGMSNMSVNDPGDVILWDTDKKEYTIISIPPAGLQQQSNTVATTAGATITIAGWNKNTDGTWSYNKADGTKVTGWVKDGNNWYYLNALGVMQTGWINDNGNWYYCNTTGAMLADTVVDGYVLGKDGVWIS